MRIACVYPDTPQWPKFRWVHEALTRLGHDVRQVRTPDELRVADRECDLCLFMHKAGGIGVQNLIDIAIGHQSHWVQWWFDLFALKPGALSASPYLNTFGRLLPRFDRVLVKERDWIANFQMLGITAEYADQGCPETMPSVKKWLPTWDVLLWGLGGSDYRQRVSDAVALSKHFKVAWAGCDAVPNGIEKLPWCHPDQLPGLASQARYVLCVDRRHDIAGYWSDRFWLATGMGACVLTRPTVGRPAGPYLTYTDHDQLLATVRENWERTFELGQEARQWVMEHHTIGQRCQHLLSRVACAVEAAA